MEVGRIVDVVSEGVRGIGVGDELISGKVDRRRMIVVRRWGCIVSDGGLISFFLDNGLRLRSEITRSNRHIYNLGPLLI